MKSNILGWSKPLAFDLNKPNDKNNFLELLDKKPYIHISDEITSSIEELYHIEHPEEIDSIDNYNYKKFISTFGELDKYGTWFYFPWNETLVHFPTFEHLSKLRASRNRNLITENERQVLFDNKTIVIAGLSVGSNVVDSLLMQGIGSRYVLVDMDVLSPTNLNRIRASFDQIGIHKVDLVAKKISELNPYLKQIHYKNGLNKENLSEIINNYSPDVIVDEMDSLIMKVLLREKAKESSIPVVMATDNGDNIILDIERYDLDKSLPILHGLLPENLIEDILYGKKLSRSELGKIIGKYFVNLQKVPLRMLESLTQVGRTIPSWPQLGGAAVLSGLYAAYAVRKILLKQPINNGRFFLGPDDSLDPEIYTSEYKEKIKDIIKRLEDS